MGLQEVLDTEKRFLMVARLLLNCPRYPVTKAVLCEIFDKGYKHNKTNYRMIQTLMDLGYVQTVQIKRKVLFQVLEKRLMRDFKDLDIVTHTFRILEADGSIVRLP